jgi:hypothetical protein
MCHLLEQNTTTVGRRNRRAGGLPGGCSGGAADASVRSDAYAPAELERGAHVEAVQVTAVFPAVAAGDRDEFKQLAAELLKTT